MRRSSTALTVLVLVACGGAGDFDSDAAAAAIDGSVGGTATEVPTILVYKTPACGCCSGWIEHMEAAGFTADVRDQRDIISVKMDAGVPTQMSSCHTTLVDGYVVEGHVPAAQVRRLLDERPDIVGIAAPGMPIGSPGMEGPNPRPYQIYSFDANGEVAVYAEIDPS